MKAQREVITLSDVCELIVDCEHKTAPTQEHGIPLIRTPNIGRGRLILGGVQRVSGATFEAWTRRAVPQEGDLILAREAPVGNVAIVPANTKVCLGQRTVLIRPNAERIDGRYLAYLLLGDEIQGLFQSLGNGATVHHLNLGDIRKLILPRIHSRPDQVKIANILSAYDDLIDSNLRRIAILEEMARTIYREWFVEFRYPGHEGTRMVDSELGPVPDGWDVTSFSDIADVLSGGTPRTSVPEYWGGDIPFFTPKDSGGSFWATTTERTITRLGLDNCNSQLYPKGTTFITARGTVGKVVLSSADMAVNQSCYALRSKDGVNQYFVFLALLEEATTLRKQAHGAVFDTITMDAFDRLKLAVPPAHLLDSWDRTVADMIQLSLNLSLTNLRLGDIRDLLLPRLISGELDASNINIDTEEDEL